MNYFVVMPSGERFGPATLAQLNQWIQEGRVLQTTTLQDAASGQVLLARDLPGLIWTPQAQPQAMVDPYSANPYGGQPTVSPYPRANDPYGNPQSPNPFSSLGLGMYDNGADKKANISLALSAAGVFLCCLCAPIGLYTAYQSKAMGARNGQVAVVVGWVATAIVFVLPSLMFFLGIFRGR